MARLGKARIERWERELLKAQALLTKVHQEAKAVQVAAKGGRYQDITVFIVELTAAANQTSLANVGLNKLREGEARRKP